MGDRRAPGQAPASSGLALRGERKRSILPVRLLVVLVGLGAIIAWQIGGVLPGDSKPPAFERVSERFSLCSNGATNQCVVDPATILYHGSVITIGDIDAPRSVGAACPEEREVAERGAARLAMLLNGGAFEMHPDIRATDGRGRKLRILKRDGVSIGGLLVRSGVARPWSGTPGNWCA